MAGHSHWAGIKHKKAANDAKRGKMWSRCSKAVIVAAKMGGGDPDQNARLRLAIADAKAARMPKDTIERAIKKGTGELAGGEVEEILYEGYGPGGVAVMCEVMTDNRNRTAPEIRNIFERCNGKLGATGCVAWMFQRKGLFVVPAENMDEDTLMELALEAGADDVKQEGQNYEVICDPDAYATVDEAFSAAELSVEVKQITRLPDTTVDLDADSAHKVLKLLEMLDDHDDVQNVSTNLNITEEVLAEMDAQ
jgi:YebC/PmpR family DNA-binding regulatory protein